MVLKNKRNRVRKNDKLLPYRLVLKNKGDIYCLSLQNLSMKKANHYIITHKFPTVEKLELGTV